MALPHHFTPGTRFGIGTGTWYRLEPQTGSADSHVIERTLWFPVTDTVQFSQQHIWNESDNLGKNFMSTVSELGSVLGNTGRDLASRFAQRGTGFLTGVGTSGGPHLSACSVYVDSSPPTMTVRTKLFSPDGSGSLIALLEELRADFTGTIGTSVGGFSTGFTAAQTAGLAQGGLVAHPEWWTVEVVSFAGKSEATLMSMKNMHATQMDVTMFAPFIGKDPSLVELSIAFTHGFRGVRESMSFGGGASAGSGSSSNASSSPPSRPRNTPASRGRTGTTSPSRSNGQSTGTNNLNPDLPWGGKPPGERFYGASVGGPST
jgi:hypothetical protein